MPLDRYIDYMQKQDFSAIITKGVISFVATCPELGVTSQGDTEKEALSNLKEAVELYLEDSDVQRMIKEGTIPKAKVCPLALKA